MCVVFFFLYKIFFCPTSRRTACSLMGGFVLKYASVNTDCCAGIYHLREFVPHQLLAKKLQLCSGRL